MSAERWLPHTEVFSRDILRGVLDGTARKFRVAEFEPKTGPA